MGAGVSIPYLFSRDTIADADQVNANFAALAAKFTGGIYDGDVATAADLDGNKLSASAGKRVPETRLENNAGSARVVASDANSPGADSNRAVSGDHIKSLTVAALARFMPALGVLLAHLKITTLSNAGSIGPVAAGTGTLYGLGLATAGALPIAIYYTGAGTVATFALYQSGGNWAVMIRNVGSVSITINVGELKVAYLS